MGPEGGTTVPNRMEAIVMAELEILHSEDLLRDTVTALGPRRLYPDLEATGVPDPVYAAARRFREDFSAKLRVAASWTRYNAFPYYCHTSKE